VIKQFFLPLLYCRSFYLPLLHGSVFVCAEHLSMMLQELLARAYKWGLTAAALCYFCLKV